jgi:hypothetical protein
VENFPDSRAELEEKAANGRRKEITVDGRVWAIEARDPFGHWHVVDPSGGNVALDLSGAYTELGLAIAAVKQYMHQNPQSPAKAEAVEKGTVPPTLKTKKVIRRAPTKEEAPAVNA